MLNVYIGYDPRQPVAYQVCAHSVWKNASQPVSITRLDLRTLPIKRRGLTEFTYSRFLVPYLSGFQGCSLFLDSDILVRGDVCELFDEEVQRHQGPAIRMVKGSLRFEWPSVIRFDNSRCHLFSPQFVESENLFKFEWACEAYEQEGKITFGGLPGAWNHLVGYDPPNPDAKIVHFTKGIPVWKETENCEFAEEWHRYFTDMLGTVSHEELMGRSVHVKREAIRT